MDKSTIFLDIDGVLALPKQYHGRKTDIYGAYGFDVTCVKILNEIVDATNAEIVLSSDWKLNYDMDTMNNIFNFNGIKTYIVHYTPSLWGVKYDNLKQLEECRANEILQYVRNHKIVNYVAIDDLNLSKWIDDEHFVLCARMNEGIKQTSLKEKIIKKLNNRI